MQETQNSDQHAPETTVAVKCDSLRETSENLQEAFDLLGDFPEEIKKKYSPNFKDLPILGPFKYKSGHTYQGQYKNGLKHGFGKQIFSDDSIYEGYWEEDKYSLWGRLIYVNGDSYEGEFKDNCAEGYGKYVSDDGNTYEGGWKKDLQFGSGKEVWEDGSFFEGEYLDSLKNGKGYFYWADGSSYKGTFVKNDISGKGKEKKP